MEDLHSLKEMINDEVDDDDKDRDEDNSNAENNASSEDEKAKSLIRFVKPSRN